MRNVNTFICLFILTASSLWSSTHAQSCNNQLGIQEYLPNKISGNVNYTIIGNTQNPFENNQVNASTCSSLVPILSTSETLVVPPGDNIVAAHLYWSGSGNPISNVQLNGNNITSERCWLIEDNNFDFFSSYADVTSIVQSSGAGTYTFTGLDNSALYRQFNCASDRQAASVLYGGWSLVVIFENPVTYSDYTIFYYDGFQFTQNDTYDVNILANVFDTAAGSNVGVVAWEGDADPSITGDDIRMNNILLPSNGYTQSNNIFNGTNSFLNPVKTNLFNADFDLFDATSVVEQQLNTPAANFNLRLVTANDVIFLNTLLLRIPNQAPDATIIIDSDLDFACVDTRTFTIDFTYRNESNASQDLPSGLPVNFYFNSLDGEVIGSTTTNQSLPPGQSASQQVQITIPNDYIGFFDLIAYIDDPSGQSETYGLVLELAEENNTFTKEGLWDTEYDFILDPLQFAICDNEEFTTKDGQVYTEPGRYPFTDTTTEVGECDSIGFFDLTVHPTFNIELPVQEICEEESFTLPSGEVITPSPRGDPYRFVSNPRTVNDCDSIVITSLLVNPLGRGEQDIDICLGQSFILPGEEQQEVNENGTYTSRILGGSANGCDSIVTTNINVLDLVYPTAFTPNGNGVNDGFRGIVPLTCPLTVDEYHLQIFNRWGELVFETFNLVEPWDGQFNELRSVPDVYIWRAAYGANGISRIQSGSVTLIR